ncbi:MAG TPA: hypothetical protein VFX30_07880 [bacterium]|nr:hypothetical protein [bacterium]
MGWKVDDVMDLLMVGGGYARESDKNMSGGSAAAKINASVVLDVAQVQDDVSYQSFFLRFGAEGICVTDGKCRLGGTAGFAGVPGILGTFAALNVGANTGLGEGSGRTQAFVGGEFGFLNVFSPAAEMWSLDARATMDVDSKSLGFMVFLNVGGSVTKAVHP